MDYKMNGLTALVYTLALTISFFAETLTNSANASIATGAQTTSSLATLVTIDSVVKTVYSSSSNTHTPDKAINANSSVSTAPASVSTGVTPLGTSSATSQETEVSTTSIAPLVTSSVIAQARYSSIGNKITTGAISINSSKTARTSSHSSVGNFTEKSPISITPSITAQASSHSSVSNSTEKGPISIKPSMTTQNSNDTSFVANVSPISVSPVKSTVTVQTHVNPNNTFSNTPSSNQTRISNDTVETLYNTKSSSNAVAVFINTSMTSSYAALVSSHSVGSLASLASTTARATEDVMSQFSTVVATTSFNRSFKMSPVIVPGSPTSGTISMKPSSVSPITGHSSEASRSPLSSIVIQPTYLTKGTTSAVTSFLVSYLSVLTASNLSSSTLPLVNASSTSKASMIPTSTTSSRPTIPEEGVKTISMEVSLNLRFKDEYENPDSKAYIELKANLTRSLEETYKHVEGFIGIRILLIRKGSVVCSFIVILAKNSAADKQTLKEDLEKAGRDKKFGYPVKNVKVEEEPTNVVTEKLPNWTLITMIVLGSLLFAFLMAGICICVKYRRSTGGNIAYGMSTRGIEMHAYETVQADDAKLRAKLGGKTSTMERRIIGSHSNPTYGSKDALADY